MTAESYEYKGLTIRINYQMSSDENDNPRSDNYKIGTILAKHRRYDIGDVHDTSDVLPSRVPLDIFISWDEVAQALRKELHAYVLPVYMYDHSGVALSTSHEYPFNDRWDAGQVGVIFTTPQRIRELYCRKAINRTHIERALSELRSEVKRYGQYVNGEVYWFEVVDKDGDVLESCGGYVGWEYVKEAAEEAARDFLEETAA